MKKLYSLATTDDIKKANLYMRTKTSPLGDVIILHRGEVLDFFTYFNSFSIKKWRQYTTIQSLMLEIKVRGKIEIIISSYVKNHKKIILQNEINESIYRKMFDINKIQGDVLGFSIRALDDQIYYLGGAYYGKFLQWDELKIGVGICTFKRENYVLKTMNVLRQFKEKNSWLSILVVDNGKTLPEENNEGLRVIHNLNFGGSGGFTRAMIEYIDGKNVAYVLLMDDDIVVEPSSLERTHSVLCSLKKKYQDSFLSGAMLTMEQPTIQYENTAYWNKIRLHGIGKNINVAEELELVKNEQDEPHKNQYGAWWYCCMPVHRIKQIGYPLPVFIKGDDIEYGIRNDRPILSMNGICVWHQSFLSKISPIINYYSDRNMLIINNFAKSCNWMTFNIAVIGRIIKRLYQRNWNGLRMLQLAFDDYSKGLEEITKIGSDQKMKEIEIYSQKKSSWKIIFQVCLFAIKIIIRYPENHKSYIRFRKKKLITDTFWKSFLRMEK